MYAPITPPPIPSREARALRERAIAWLSARYAEDALSLAELEDHLDAVYLAATEADIRAVITGVGMSGIAPRGGAGGERLDGPSAAIAHPDRERYVAFMSERRRSGLWVMPERLVVTAIMSHVTLDLTRASLPPSAEVSVLAIMSNVSLVVPPGVAVDARVVPVAGVAGDATEPVEAPSLDGSRLLVRGTAILSEVRTRPPRAVRAGR